MSVDTFLGNTRGVLLFAFNTDTVNYIRIAEFAAKRITNHLKLPVTLVTAAYDNKDNIFERVIIQETPQAQARVAISENIGELHQWRNFNRCDAYRLTPYDETLLLDCDYIVNSPQLLRLFESTEDIMCHSSRAWIGSSSHKSVSPVETFGETHMAMMWATVVFFRKSELAAAVFDMWTRVQANYSHYASLYRFDGRQFRNDYALTIALNTVLGHGRSRENEINWTLMNCEGDTRVTKEGNTYRLEFVEPVNGIPKNFYIQTSNMDLHILNKESIMTLSEIEHD